MNSNAPKYKVTIHCGCGRTHSNFEEWQQCPMALTPVALDPWYREVAKTEEK